MLVKDVMNADVKTVDADATIQEAAQLMSRHRVGCLIVTKDSRLMGIITEDDILRKVVAEAKNASKGTVKDYMTKDVIMVSPSDDIETAIQIMLDKKIKKLPVVSGNRLIGIVTTTDICTAEPELIKKVSELLLVPGEKKMVAG
jgi:CBS domain-containing protein